HSGLSPSEVSSLYSSLTMALSQKSYAVTTSVANRFFLDKEFTLKSDFQSHVEKAFNSGAENLDFKHGGEAAERVNSFVSENTGGMITNLVDSGSFANAAAILINAVYFKGALEKQFEKRLTETKKFHGILGDRDTRFMRAHDIYMPYYLTKSLVAVSLQYRDPSYSLVVIMPMGDFGEWCQADGGVSARYRRQPQNRPDRRARAAQVQDLFDDQRQGGTPEVRSQRHLRKRRRPLRYLGQGRLRLCEGGYRGLRRGNGGIRGNRRY
ncbi:hypothetical protein PENTCL1PPCAC_1576, partial [Pristionchus entomophagus]